MSLSPAVAVSEVEPKFAVPAKSPVVYTFPDESTAIPMATLFSVPDIWIAHRTFPALSNFAIKPFCPDGSTLLVKVMFPKVAWPSNAPAT